MLLHTKNARQISRNKLLTSTLLASTALAFVTTMASAESIPAGNTSSVISQTRSGAYTNSVDIQKQDDQNFSLNAEGNFVQDAATGNNTLNLVIKNSAKTVTDTNLIYATQLGGVVSTITVDGGANTVTLASIGGYLSEVENTIKIVGDGNTFTLGSNAVVGEEAFADSTFDIVGSNNAIVLTTDAFSQMWLTMLGSGDSVTITQDNTAGGQAGTLDFNLIDANIASTVVDYDSAAALNNVVTITQLGLDNELDFDLLGDKNTVNITQSNVANSVNANNLTVNLTDSNADLDVEVYGGGTNAIIAAGSENIVTLDSDTEFSSVIADNAEAYIEVYGDNNSVTASNFDKVRVLVADEFEVRSDNTDNAITIIGNANVELLGSYNDISFTNDFDYDKNQTLFIGVDYVSSSNNEMTLVNAAIAFGSADQTSYDFSVDGYGNTTNGESFTTNDAKEVDISLNGDYNKLYGALTAFDYVSVDLDGSGNSLNLSGKGAGLQELQVKVTGDDNQMTTTGESTEINSRTYSATLEGSHNAFSYTLGDDSFTHHVRGDDFAGTVVASLSGGYVGTITNVGTGSSVLSSSGSEVIIASGCEYGSTCVGTF